MADNWASDVRISLPQPMDMDNPPHIDLGGFAFNPNGLLHNLTSEQIEAIYLPRFAPLPRGKDSKQ